MKAGYYTVKIGGNKIRITSICFNLVGDAELWAEFLNEQTPRKRDKTNVVMYLSFPNPS